MLMLLIFISNWLSSLFTSAIQLNLSIYPPEYNTINTVIMVATRNVLLSLANGHYEQYFAKPWYLDEPGLTTDFQPTILKTFTLKYLHGLPSMADLAFLYKHDIFSCMVARATYHSGISHSLYPFSINTNSDVFSKAKFCQYYAL